MPCGTSTGSFFNGNILVDIYTRAPVCVHARASLRLCANAVYIKFRADITLVSGVNFHGDGEISTRKCNEIVTSLVVIDDGFLYKSRDERIYGKRLIKAQITHAFFLYDILLNFE